MAENKEIIISIKVKEVGAKPLSKNVKGVTKDLRNLTDAERKQRVENELLKESNKRLSKSFKDEAIAALDASEAQEQLNKKLQEGRTSAGLAGAIVTEFGRTISDLPFGLRGVGNNLSQLATLFGLFAANAKTSGISLRDAFKELGQQFLGPVGILTLVQILITLFQSERVNKFVKSLFGLSGALRELSDLTESYSQELGKLTGNFRLYIDILNDSNRTEEEKSIALKKLNKEYPDYNSNLIKERKNLDDINKENERYIKLLQERALSIAAQAKLEEIAKEFGFDILTNKIEQIRLEKELEKQQKNVEKFTKDFQENKTRTNQANLSDAIRLLNLTKSQISTLKEETSEITKEYDKRKKIITEFVKLTDRDDDGGKTQAAVARFGEFMEARFVLDKDIEKIEQDSLARFLETEQAKLVQEEINQKNTYRVRFKTFVDTQKFRQQEFEEAQERRLKDFLNRKKDSEKTKQELQEDLNARKNFDEAILKSKQELNSSIKDGERELDEVLKAIEENYKDRRVILNKELAQEALELAYKLESIQAQSFDKQSRLPEIFQSKSEEASLRYLQSQIELQTDLVNIFKEGTVERMNAEIALAELQGKLADAQRDREIRRFNEIKEIYKQATGVITGISNTRKNIEINNARAELEARIAAGEDEIEAKKKYDAQVEEANKKAWKIEQGLKISRVIMDTYQAGILAYGSQLIVGDPTSPIRAQIAQALTLANGAAQIAAILATKYDSKNLKGVSGPSSGGRDVTVEAPDFNVVGASPESQLVGSIGPILSKPMKAFVVESEITDAQNNVANYRETSST